MSPEYVCSKCKSDNIKRLQVLHEEGQSKVNVMTLGGGSSAIGGNVNIGYSGGDIISKLAEKAKPPDKPLSTNYTTIGGIIFILVGVLLYVVFDYVKIGATIVILTVLSMWFTAKKDQEDYQKSLAKHRKDMMEWNKSYMCLRCGHIFQINN